LARWEPNASERLQEAALGLFRERGYDRTTVEEIAARAGLTERTFFRYFSDKREVLFAGAKALEKLVTGAVAGAAANVAPLDAVAAAFEATAPLFETRRPYARERQALVLAHPELQERELIKLAALAAAVTESLEKRGLGKTRAGLVAEAGIAIFKHAFERWLDDAKKRDLAHHVRAVLSELRHVTAAPAARTTARRATRRRSTA